MLTDTLSGKCPCCGYDKLLQRYGSSGYYQLDGCPNCGFGYGSNGIDDTPEIGVEAWIDYAAHSMAMLKQSEYVYLFEDDPQIIREGTGWIEYNEGETKEEKAFNKALEDIMALGNEGIRQMVFDWAEKQERSDDVAATIFVYPPEDIEKYLATKPKIFKPIDVVLADSVKIKDKAADLIKTGDNIIHHNQKVIANEL